MRFFTPLEEGQTPLHELAFLGDDLNKLSWLIAEGAPVNAQNDKGWTPLVCAIRRGKVDMVAVLLAGRC